MKLLFGGLGVQEANPPNVQSFVLLLFEKMAQIRNGKELYQNLTIAKKKLPKDFHAVKAPLQIYKLSMQMGVTLFAANLTDMILGTQLIFGGL